MTLWDRLIGRQPVQAKAAFGGRSMASLPLGQPAWTERRYDRFADEAYVKNAVAYRCVKMIAGACSSIPWLLYKGPKRSPDEVEDHALLDLLTNPTPQAPGADVWEAFFAYLLIAGNTYLHGNGPSDTRPPTELLPLRPDRTQVTIRTLPGTTRKVLNGYRHTVEGTPTDWLVDQVTGASPILHVKEFNPLNDWYGLARVDPAAYGIDRHNAASAHNKALLDNGGRPGGALIFEPVVVNGQPQSAPESVIAAAEVRLAERHGGPEHAGWSLVLGGNVKWVDMSVSPKDMDFGAGKDDAARDICSAFGVPHILIVPGSATYNNVREARLEFYEDTVLPLADHARKALNGWLTPRFDDRMWLEHDLDQVPALEPRREAKRNAVLGLWKGGLLKRNEARDALQYDKIEGPAGDELAVPSIAGEEPAVGGESLTADPKPEPPKA